MTTNNNWISVVERLPEQAIDVLAYCDGDIVITDMFIFDEDVYWNCHFGRCNVTHWQPLPTPPEAFINEND